MEVGSGVAESKANRLSRLSEQEHNVLRFTVLLFDLSTETTLETFCAVQELARTNNEILRPEKIRDQFLLSVLFPSVNAIEWPFERP
ncbi:hypothetical protein M3Y98_00618900 [Aphelenchoides besseyi]|nr:hypothetical protein M3Y98_00618900 [Aphelenchoides besseyi]KAI6208359.1 hypothetical protein M3Y96_00106900 [Aphelenchoides besseyi]